MSRNACGCTRRRRALPLRTLPISSCRKKITTWRCGPMSTVTFTIRCCCRYSTSRTCGRRREYRRVNVAVSLLQILCRRLLLASLVIFGVLVVTFITSRLIPGDPARLMTGEHASRETVQHMRHVLGLDKPLPEQFGIYLVKLAHGDLGISIRTERPVSEDIRRFFPATIELSLAALLFAVLAGLPLGVLSAVHKDTWIDQ